MRIRRRSAIVLASVAAFGVGLIAFPASAAAVVVPACTPNADNPQGTFSRSCVTLKTTGLAAGPGGPFSRIGAGLENIRLGVRTRATFIAGSEWKGWIPLRFDDNIQINLPNVAGFCTAASLSGKTIAQAWVQCGPGPGGSNTYLSTGLGASVSGVASTTVAGIDACTMVFKGANNNQILLYLRLPIGNPDTECSNPATNSGGTVTIILVGNVTTPWLPGHPSLYSKVITVNNVDVANPPLDDFYATLSRGTAFRANCPPGQSPHKIEGVFDYTPVPPPSDPTDTISPPYQTPAFAGTQDSCLN